VPQGENDELLVFHTVIQEIPDAAKVELSNAEEPGVVDSGAGAMGAQSPSMGERPGLGGTRRVRGSGERVGHGGGHV
jgi:hypothetical protein